MKIRTDFITNSSSTSFIIMTKNDFSEDDFLNLMGIEKNSDFYDMMKNLYDSLLNSMEDIDIYVENENLKNKYSSVEDFLKGEFSSDVYEKYLIAKKENRKIYVGSLSSDEKPFVAYVCMDYVEEENEKIYFNYTNCIW